MSRPIEPIGRCSLILSARVDFLTGCYNRSHLMRRLMEEGARAEPLDHPFSFVLIDVDHFKDVNDEHGHLFGDDVLKAVARQIHCSVRRMDVVARFGGEEFACLLPDASHDVALLIAERIAGPPSSPECPQTTRRDSSQVVHPPEFRMAVGCREPWRQRSVSRLKRCGIATA